ncbi:MAG: DUF1569 domain-containing protein [Bacteroidia bacterium]|jgi:hypothetical protein|nr:DUF1569 domain-containing protein [Bacteroidia bacterium]
MPSLFNQPDLQAILARFDSIQGNTRPEWGKMNAAQMIRHCTIGLEYALGDKRGKQAFMGKLFGSAAKKKLKYGVQFKPNVPTSPEFVVTTTDDIDTEKSRLREKLLRFGQGPHEVRGNPSLFYGNLTTDEWDMFMYNHLDHHLRQFGA